MTAAPAHTPAPVRMCELFPFALVAPIAAFITRDDASDRGCSLVGTRDFLPGPLFDFADRRTLSDQRA